MYLKLGDVVIPPVPHAAAVAATRHVDGLTGPAETGWWPTADFVPLYWYAGVVVPLLDGIGNVIEPPTGPPFKESHVVVAGPTAARLDAAFAAAGDAGLPVSISDGTTTIDFGAARMHSKILLRQPAGAAAALWLYEFVFYAPLAYRASIQRRLAFAWRDVMLADTYPVAGSPATPGPAAYDPTADTLYQYAASNGTAVTAPFYDGGVDVQFDSGCRFGQTLEPDPADPTGRTWRRRPPRFWTLAEAAATAEAEWAKWGPKLIFGGRVPPEQMAGNLPAAWKVSYQTGSPPTPAAVTIPTGLPLAAGSEPLDLGTVHSAANLSAQIAAFQQWELGRRRLFQAVFLGLVPWRLTPFDAGLEFRLPIDGLQLPVTILNGDESRSWDAPDPTVANPAPPGNTITVTFTRPSDPANPHSTLAPAGALTRVGYGSSPAVPATPVPPGATTVVAYTDLPDGGYTFAPGSPWSPATASVSVAGGASATLTFTVT